MNPSSKFRLSRWFWRLIAAGAGEGAAPAAPAAAAPAGAAGGAGDTPPAAAGDAPADPPQRGSFFADEEDDTGNASGKAAGTPPPDDDDDPPAGDGSGAAPAGDAGAESGGGNATTPGDGGEDGGDPVAEATLKEALRAQLGLKKQNTKPSKKASEHAGFKPDDALKTEFRKLIDAGDDYGAMLLVVNRGLEQAFSGYDEGRMTPMLNAVETQQRTERILRSNAAFVDEFPGAFTEPGRQERMMNLFDEMRVEYGDELALSVTPEQYYRMAGGRKVAKSKGGGKGGAKPPAPAAPAAGTAAKKAEADKKAALAGISQPAAITATPVSPTGGKKPSKDEAIMRETEKYIHKRSTPAFTIR